MSGFLIELPVTVMTRMFKDNFKVNNDSFAALVNSNFSNVTGNFRSIQCTVVVFVLEMTCASIVHACKHAFVQHKMHEDGVNMLSLSDISL